MGQWGYLESITEVTRLTRGKEFRPDYANADLSEDDVLLIGESIARSEIDPILRTLGATTPISKGVSPSGFHVLKDINALGTACRLDRIMFTDEKPSGRDDRPWACLEFDKKIEQLQKGDLDLIDVDNLAPDEDLSSWSYGHTRYFTDNDKF